MGSPIPPPSSPHALWQEFHGPNAGYVLELFDRYRRDPESVDAATRAFFDRWQPPDDSAPGNGHLTAAVSIPTRSADKIMGAVNLATAIREYGHLAASIDPLGQNNPPGDPALLPEAHGVTVADLRELTAAIVGGPGSSSAGNAYEAIEYLRTIYSSTIGYDYDHIRLPEERAWLRTAAESRQFRPPNEPIDPLWLLEQLTKIEAFEHFLHRIFPGKTRFSVEGLDMMVPMLDVVLGKAAEAGIYSILIGMAHRGRLNVLAHNLQKPYDQILQEFRDALDEEYGARDYVGWSGDVKYHAGASRALAGNLVDLVVKMAPNPSHLEHINPVIAGMARAAGTKVDAPGRPRFNPSVVLPLVIHGDAAFPGQGIVAETLNLQRLRGYRIGGTIHIIANNQVGFTTSQWEGRSTLYASDLAKGFKVPVVHVNADDPIACIEVARLACAYRARFQTDFVIDLVGYRRYGHNEGDEPRFTQPTMYSAIEQHPTVRQQWAAALVREKVASAEWAEERFQQHIAHLSDIYQTLPPKPSPTQEPQLEPPPSGAARRVNTAAPRELLLELNEALLAFPKGFRLNRKLARVLDRRREVLSSPDGAGIDWGHAEALAFGTILAEGISIRMTGEDVERGTFSHRHAVLREETTGAVYIPLQHLPQARVACEVRNSPLSENATIGFEYGYNIEAPDRLVIWEAQYGDFINTAQAIIDEFVVSGRAKWEQTPSLVLLLPHGYEGQGPDHSTGRLERFLQLAAEINMRIAYPTTAAQYFHLLRRQAKLLTIDPLPLIVMTPKSLLRHPLATSTLSELAEGHWQPVIYDPLAVPESVTRLILCSGKVYVDLAGDQRRAAATHLAAVRLEQLYPLRTDELEAVFARYPNAKEVIWLQEEPANAGAWEAVQPALRNLLGSRMPLTLISRPRWASPAEGFAATHARNQARLLDRVFELQP
jgi:2-oxoglutarate dehydrogenase E1 component